MSPQDLRVRIAMPIHGSVPPRTMVSLNATLISAARRGQHIEMEPIVGCGIVTKARSLELHNFLKSDCDRLYWVDSDMEFTPYQFNFMLALSEKMDVVGATYPAKIDPPSYFLRWARTDGMYDYNEYGCIEMYGFGLGFTVISREVAEKVAASKPLIYDEMTGTFMRDVFRIDTTDSATIGSANIPGCPEEWYGKPLPALRGEDMAFFADCREAGYKVWMYPDMDLGHCGTKLYRGDLMEVLGLRQLMERKHEADDGQAIQGG